MNARLSVLHIGAFPFPFPQGSQVYVAGMCRALASAGACVSLATYGAGAAEGGWPDGVQRVPVPSLPRLTAHRSGPHAGKIVLDAALAAAVARHLSSERVDVVHAHNVEAPFIAALGRSMARSRVPLVYNLHTSLAEELPVYWPRGIGGKVAAPLGRMVDECIPRIADACVALSPRAEAHLLAHGARHVALIPPGVDPDELLGGDADRARTRWALDARPWILYAGNLDAYQDVDLLMAAMRWVPDAGLLLATSAAAGEAWSLVDAASLPRERVRIVARSGLPELVDALAVAKLGAVPRRVCTGFPIKLLNLLSAGVVTVAATGSSQDVAGCVPGGDTPESFGRAMAACLADMPGLDRQSIATRAAVASSWTWAARATQLLQFYETLV